MAKCITCNGLCWVVTCPLCQGVGSIACTKCWRRGYLPDIKARHVLRCPDCGKEGVTQEWAVLDKPWVWHDGDAKQATLLQIEGTSYKCRIGKKSYWFVYQDLYRTEAEVWTEQKLIADVRLHEAIKADFELNQKYLESRKR